MKTVAPILTVLAALASPGIAAQTLYKCVQGGQTQYQAQPCPASATQDTLKARADAAAAAPGATGQVDRTIDFMSTYRACADGVTMWRQEMAAPYEAWRSRNAAMVSRIETDRQLHARYLKLVDGKRNGRAGMCRNVGLELRGVKH